MNWLRWPTMILFAVSTFACGDLSDPTLISCDVELNDDVVQTMEIDVSGSNFFSEDVNPNSNFVLIYDEPINLSSAKSAISIVNNADEVVVTEITQRLLDVIVTPTSAMSTGENHTLRVNSGIDDESRNTTDYYVNITFFVDN